MKNSGRKPNEILIEKGSVLYNQSMKLWIEVQNI